MTVEIDSFMSVLGGTQEDANGIFLPGDIMPSGNPIRSDGVTKLALMSDKSLAEGWYNAVKAQYAREEEERTRIKSEVPAPRAAPERADTPARVDGARPAPAESPDQTLEEKLQAEYEDALAVRDEVAKLVESVAVELERAERHVSQLAAALGAVRDA